MYYQQSKCFWIRYYAARPFRWEPSSGHAVPTAASCSVRGLSWLVCGHCYKYWALFSTLLSSLMQCFHFSVLSLLFLIPYFFLLSVFFWCLQLFICICFRPFFLCLSSSLSSLLPFCLLVSIFVCGYGFFQIFVCVRHFLHCPLLHNWTVQTETVTQTVLTMCGHFSTSGNCKASTSIQATTALFYVFAVNEL
jgi:hypothetical protein